MVFREETPLNCRADAVYNRFFIDIESPGSPHDDRNYKRTAKAVHQVKMNIEGMVQAERYGRNRLLAWLLMAPTSCATIRGLAQAELKNIRHGLAELKGKPRSKMRPANKCPLCWPKACPVAVHRPMFPAVRARLNAFPVR